MRDYGIDASLKLLTVTVDGIHTSAFIHEPNYSSYASAVMSSITDERKTTLLRQRFEKNAESALDALSHCLKDFNSKNWKKFLYAYMRFAASLNPPTVIGRTGSEKLSSLLKDCGVPEDNLAETMSVITYPDEHPPLFLSRLDLLKIGSRIQNGEL